MEENRILQPPLPIPKSMYILNKFVALTLLYSNFVLLSLLDAEFYPGQFAGAFGHYRGWGGEVSGGVWKCI